MRRKKFVSGYIAATTMNRYRQIFHNSSSDQISEVMVLFSFQICNAFSYPQNEGKSKIKKANYYGKKPYILEWTRTNFDYLGTTNVIV